MNKLHIAVAAALALGSQFASAQVAGPFEGGESASHLAAFASTADRATIAAQGREAARRINSRSGHQGVTEQAINARFTSTRSRDDVRAEALASRGDTQVYEGGQSSAVVTRTVSPVPATLASGETNLVR